MAWSDFFLHISPALRNEIRRSQIDGWLTGVDRHIALTSVKKLRRANRWLSPTVQLFPFADTDCCACKKSRSVKNSHLCRGGDGGFLLVLDERNRKQAPTLFALPKQLWYPRVKQHLHGLLERSAHSSYVFPRNAHRFCTTQSEKDKTTQISKIQIYMVPCTCRRRGRAPFSLNFLSIDQAYASGRVCSWRSNNVPSKISLLAQQKFFWGPIPPPPPLRISLLKGTPPRSAILFAVVCPTRALFVFIVFISISFDKTAVHHPSRYAS